LNGGGGDVEKRGEQRRRFVVAISDNIKKW
jgi:hypothetical protein